MRALDGMHGYRIRPLALTNTFPLERRTHFIQNSIQLFFGEQACHFSSHDKLIDVLKKRFFFDLRIPA